MTYEATGLHNKSTFPLSGYSRKTQKVSITPNVHLFVHSFDAEALKSFLCLSGSEKVRMKYVHLIQSKIISYHNMIWIFIQNHSFLDLASFPSRNFSGVLQGSIKVGVKQNERNPLNTAQNANRLCRFGGVKCTPVWLSMTAFYAQ